MKRLAHPRIIVVILLCLLSDYLITVNAHICEVGREKNQHNEWKWVLPYPDPCKCTQIIMGGVNTWTPIRPFVPVYVDSPLLSDNVIAIREHYGLTCSTGTMPDFTETSSCSSGTDSSAGTLDTATTKSQTENDASESTDILFTSQGETSGTDGTEAETSEPALTTALGSTAAESSTNSATSDPRETNRATSAEAGTSEHAGTTASGSTAAESSTNSLTSVSSKTSEATSAEAGTSDHAGTTASGSTAAESSTNSVTSVPSKTSVATSAEAGTSEHADTTASGSTAAESSTNSVTSVPSKTSVATSAEAGTSDHAGTTASGRTAAKGSTNSLSSDSSETSEATSTEAGTSITTSPTYSMSTSRSITPKVCYEYLGMENSDIPDVNIEASYFYGIFTPSNGRLNGNSYWACGDIINQCTSEPTTWIQADIGYQTHVSGVITQGEATLTGYAHFDWVTALKLSTFQITTDDNQVFVTDGNGQVKVFQANTDRNTPVTSSFPSPVYARIVRITCVSKYRVYWTMRFEILGCKQAIH